MAQETITLPKLAEEVESGNFHYHKKIKVANWDSFDNFMAYYRQHYLPLLRAICDGEELDDKQRQRLAFLAEDIIMALHEEDESDHE